MKKLSVQLMAFSMVSKKLYFTGQFTEILILVRYLCKKNNILIEGKKKPYDAFPDTNYS